MKEAQQTIDVEVIDRELLTINKEKLNKCTLEFFETYIRLVFIYEGEETNDEKTMHEIRQVDNVWFIFKDFVGYPHIFYNNVSHNYNVMIGEQFGLPGICYMKRKDALALLNKIVEWKIS